jgi:hypothetical protein
MERKENKSTKIKGREVKKNENGERREGKREGSKVRKVIRKVRKKGRKKKAV